MPKNPSLAIVRHSGEPSISQLVDTQTGPLAEAQAIADVINIVATDNTGLRDDSLAVLSRMLVDRLDLVRTAVEGDVARSAA